MKSKKLIQEKFKNQLGLRVDQPIPGGAGTTNTGNVARRAFKDPQKLSEILELDYDLICNLRIILMLLSCHENVDPEKYDELAKTTAKMFVENYSWFNMTPTLHRILIHGAQVIRSSVLPVGMFAEHAAESLNKLYRYERIFHARKDSMEHNIFDMFTRLQISSDPFISSIKLQDTKTKKKSHLKSLELNQYLISDDSSDIDLNDLLNDSSDEEDDIELVNNLRFD